MTLADFSTRLEGWYVRKTVRFFSRRPLEIKNDRPIISFTFDDFPRSALQTGGAILKKYRASGTYYAAFGLMAKNSPTGFIFTPEDLPELLKQGHELGCHTFAHCDSWRTDPKVFEQSIVDNRKALEQLVPGGVFQSFSYPISVPNRSSKSRTSRHFICCRGGGQTFNAGMTDLNYLYAFFLEKSRDNPQVIRDLIDENRRQNGWLILATHDVCESPSPFGCSPEFFEGIVKYAADSGALILPVIEAVRLLDPQRQFRLERGSVTAESPE